MVIRILRSWFCSLIGLLEWSLCLFAGHEKWSLKCLLKQGNGFLWVWIWILSPVLILVKARTSFSFKVSRGERNKLNYCIVLCLVQGSLPWKAVQNADGLAVPCSVVMLHIWELQGFTLDLSLAIIRNAFCTFGRLNAVVNQFSSIEISKLCCVHIYRVECILPCWTTPIGQHCILECATCGQRRWSDCSRDNPRFCLGDFGCCSSAWKRAGKDLGIGGLNHISDRDGNGRRHVQVIVTPQVGTVVNLPAGSLMLHQKWHGQQKPSSGLPNWLVVQKHWWINFVQAGSMPDQV